MTIRRHAPEGTVFTTLWFEPDTMKIHHVFISVGKAGTALNAAADLAARFAGLASRSGIEPGRLAYMVEGIAHDRTGNGHDAKSLADAVGQSFRYFEGLIEERNQPEKEE